MPGRVSHEPEIFIDGNINPDDDGNPGNEPPTQPNNQHTTVAQKDARGDKGVLEILEEQSDLHI